LVCACYTEGRGCDMSVTSIGYTGRQINEAWGKGRRETAIQRRSRHE
jgi:hypothetical protein